MKTKWIMAAGMAAIMAFTASVQALPYVNGGINMSGSVTLDSSSLGSANSAAFSNPAARVTSASGAYFGVPTGISGQTVNFSNFGWNPDTTPVSPLWSFNYSGVDYSFVLNALNVVSQSDTFLNVVGSGVAKIDGYQDTYGTWSFTITSTGPGSTFEFGFANSNTSVPDGGTTVMLLGGALSGLALLRKKLA